MLLSPRNQDRFWSKVNKTASCWFWQAATLRGYGRFWSGGSVYAAHRLAYEMLVGPIPPSLTIDHICRTTHCVNPDHMEIVTSAENTRRGHAGTSSLTCKHGHVFTADNTYLEKQTGKRKCKTCDSKRKRERYERTKLAVSQ